MNKYLIALLLSASASCAAFAALPSKLLPTRTEEKTFFAEAEDFLDIINDGRQDRQCDAVLHALRGQTSELAVIREGRNSAPSLPEGADCRDIEGDGSARGVRMRLYSPTAPQSGPLPLLVYLHGGGWTFGSLNSCAKFCGALAATSKAMVLAVDYRLAPETPFPGGMTDCVAAVEYAAAHAEEWGSSPSLISLGGDSSGGNLALASALYMQETSSPAALRSLLLFYPVVKAYADGSASWKSYSKGYGLDGRLMNAFNDAYIHGQMKKNDGAADAYSPLVSPAESGDDKLAKLPPVLVVGAERDILFDQGKEFVLKMKNAGGDAQHVAFPGAVHLFITVDGQPSAFAKAVALSAAFLSD